MPATSGSPSQIGTSAATPAVLAGTPDDQFQEGDLACVVSLWPNSTFRLRRTALGGVPDNITTIATFTGNGYWELLLQGGGNMLVFPTVEGDPDSLAAFDDLALLDGATVYVQSVRSYFHKRIQAAPGTADGITNVQNPSNTATWYRDTEASPSWVNTLGWYLDEVNGDDENLGNAPGLALQTHGEFMRRIGANTLTGNTTLTVIGEYTGFFNHSMALKQHFGGAAPYQIRYRADLDTANPIYTSTFLNYATISRVGTGERATFTSPVTSATWNASYRGKLIVVTAAANPLLVGAYAWVDNAVGDLPDVVHIYTTPFTLASAANGGDSKTYDPADGDTFVIVDPGLLTPDSFSVSGGGEADLTLVTFDNLQIDASGAPYIADANVGMYASSLVSTLTVSGSGELNVVGFRLGGGELTLTGSAIYTMSASYFDGRDTPFVFYALESSTATIDNDTIAALEGEFVVEYRATLGNFGAFDYTDGGGVIVVALGVGAQLEIAADAYIYGDNNSNYFFTMASMSRVVADQTATFLASTGASANISFGDVIEKDWADLPFIANALVTDSQAAWVNLV